MKKAFDAKESFFKKVFPEPNTGCWLWSGAAHPRYGHGCLNGQFYEGLNWAHRYSYFVHNGDFDRSLCVCHKCDNPSCVNPEHLFLGTAHDNQHDKIRKGRQQRGEKHAFAKLSEQDVKDIRELKASGLSFGEIAKSYNMNITSIFHVVNKKNWKHIE
jgi:hypothetical protein